MPWRLADRAEASSPRDGEANRNVQGRACHGRQPGATNGEGDIMTDRKIWFITGAGRGMGVDFARAALAAGHAVVATGRDPDAVARAVGASDDLLVVRLDVTRLADAEAAARAAVERFGRIDVLVNNAANFHAGYFEELTPDEVERQL